jgi:hypothetical protein
MYICKTIKYLFLCVTENIWSITMTIYIVALLNNINIINTDTKNVITNINPCVIVASFCIIYRYIVDKQ